MANSKHPTFKTWAVSAAAAGCLSLGLASTASATPSASWSTALPSPAAILADPTLAGSITNSLNVTIPAGLDWQGAKIRISLTSGTVYNAAANLGGTEDAPNSALWTALPAQQYDTFVNSKGYGSATQIGTVNADGSDGPLPSSGLSGTGSTTVNVAWVDVVLNESGTFPVGQFTLSAGATGSYIGFVADEQLTIPISGRIVGGVLVPAPEPASAGLLGAAAVAGLLARRRRARSARA